MSNYTLSVTTTNWHCECCGYGTHFSIVLFEEDQRVWSTSRNDQFGDVLDEAVDEEMDLHRWEDFVKGMKKALEIAGHNVLLVENIDRRDPDEEYDWADEEEDYRDDLL